MTPAGTIRLLVSGMRYELWEDPDRPFGCAPGDLARYVEHEAWILLFNAMVLTATALTTEPVD